MTNVRMHPGAAFERRRFGKVWVTAISDGFIDASLRIFANLPPEEAQGLLAAAKVPLMPRISVNAYLLESAGRLALIDTGAGHVMGPTLGRLPQSLAAAGVERSDIPTVLLTHMHPDHSNGLTDADGRLCFPKAELLVHEAEVGHWCDDARMAEASPRARRDDFEAARRQLKACEGRVRTFTEGEIFPGVRGIPIPGHTPGHTGYLVGEGAGALFIWGDTVHVPEIQVPRPEVVVRFDTDPHMACETRRRVFDMAAANSWIVAGMHLHFPGYAHVVRLCEGYALRYPAR